VYRETVLGEADGHAVFERELKEQRIYGEASCHVRSLPRGSGVTFSKQLPAALLVPEAVIEAAQQGLRDAASSGVDGYPLEDVAVTLTGVGVAEGADGVIGCRAAASESFRRACAAAHPTRLEPIMSVEVTTDDDSLGAIIGDVNQRRGQIQDVALRGVKQIVTALVPLRAMFGYSTRVRSLSEGRATFVMKFHTYDTLAG
jgi:elongation factor G